MFFTFLNKGEVNYLDLTIIRKYPPDKILFYFYNSAITIPISTYTELISIIENEKAGQYLLRWYQLLHDLDTAEDIEAFRENEFLDIIGPYYYPATNTRLYFVKDYLDNEKYFTLEDFELLNSLLATPNSNKDLQAYYKNRRNAKKSAKNKEELLKDIEMCIKSFTETQILNQHINYLNKLLESRYSIVENNNLEPLMPDIIPVKPHILKENNVSKDNVISFTKIKLKRKTETTEASFNHDTKVYFIRYREYEKACDRYKLILSNWPDLSPAFLEKCYYDIEEAEEKLKKAAQTLDMYNQIIEKSYIHSDYQDTNTLEKFKYYLETGRADNLQDCMNLFEDERYWKDIKASQNRIENTIYFLQSETDLTRFADENINKYLKQFNEVAACIDEISD